jgi:hypothetical protein
MNALAKGAALAYAERELGGPVAELESVVATGASPVSLCGNNPDGVELVLVNLGANPVFIGLTPQVSAAMGITLNASGGSVSMNVLNDATLPAREWFGISPAGASTIYVLRLVRYALSEG